MNQVIAIGNLGNDPEFKELEKSGNQVASFRLASTDRRRKGPDGKPATEWLNVVAWGKLAVIVRDYLKKGSKIFVAGRLQTRKYEGKDGTTKYATEVIADNIEMLDGAKKVVEHEAEDDGIPY